MKTKKPINIHSFCWLEKPGILSRKVITALRITLVRMITEQVEPMGLTDVRIIDMQCDLSPVPIEEKAKFRGSITVTASAPPKAPAAENNAAASRQSR